MNKRILVVEPQPLTRQGIALTLQAEPGLEVCAQAGSVARAVAAFDACAPDLVLTSLDLPDGNGLELTDVLRRRRPGVFVLLLSRHAEALCAERALRAGARGYLVKQEAADRVVQAVHRVLAGRYCVSEGVLDELLQVVSRSVHPLIPAPTDVLSGRELELFEWIGAGLGTHEIADRMALSIKTVESYRNRIKQKLNVASMADLMRRAVMWKAPEHACYTWQGGGPSLGAELLEAADQM